MLRECGAFYESHVVGSSLLYDFIAARWRPCLRGDSRSQIHRYNSLDGRLAPASDIYTFVPPGYETDRTSHLIFTFRRFSSHLAIYRKRVDKISCALCFWRLRSQGQIRRLRACETPEAVFRNRRRVAIDLFARQIEMGDAMNKVVAIG